MAVEDRAPVISYVGNGTAAPLAVPFQFLQASDLIVTLFSADGGSKGLVRGVDYNVSGAGDEEGGSVTPSSAIAVGDEWEIKRASPLEQPTRFSDGYYSAEAQETALDRQMLAMQEQSRDIIDLSERALRVRRGELMSPLPSLEQRRGRGIMFDANGFPYATNGGGADDMLREDLASPDAGARLVATAAGTVQDELDEFRSVDGAGSIGAAGGSSVQALLDAHGEGIGQVDAAQDVLTSQVAGLGASVTNLGQQFTDLSAAVAAGPQLIYSTRAALYANTTAAADVGATVLNDPTLAYNGLYQSTGTGTGATRWTQVAAGRIETLEASASTVVSFKYPIVYDKDNVLGGGAESLYVARELYAKRGATVLSGTFGTASPEISTHIKLTVQNDLSTVYIDLTDGTNPVKVALFPTLAPVGTSYIVLATIRSGTVDTPHAIEYANELQEGKIIPRAPLAVDGTKILVPRFYFYRRRDGFTLYQPSDGSYYFEGDLSVSASSETRVYFDKIAADAGTPVKSASGAVYPTAPGRGNQVVGIASSLARAVSTDLPIHTVVENSMFLRGNDPDRAILYSTNATLANITDVNLTTLGITRGVTGTEAYYGEDLPPNTPKKGYYFARVYVQASADDTFQSPRLYVLDSQGNTIAFASMTLEKRLSARAALYIAFGEYEYSAQPAFINIGTFQTTNQVIVGGAQAYIGAVRFPWLRRGTWPSAPSLDLTYGPDMFFVYGRALPFYPDNLFGSRSPSPILSIASPRPLLETDFDIQTSGASVLLNPADMGSTISLTAIGQQERSAIKRRTVVSSQVALPLTGSPKILMLGDSITNRQTGYFLKQFLEDWGLTPSWIGTIPGANTTTTLSTGGPLGEGREGWATTDYLGTSTADDVTNGVLAVGDEAIYLAASKDGKAKYQPFLNPTLGAGSSAPVVTVSDTQYRFDMAFYLGRFSLAEPDIVVVNVGMNDLLEGYSSAAETVAENLAYMVAEIRRALPSAKILLWSTTVPYGQYGDGRQREVWSAIQRSMVVLVEGLRDDGDTNIYLCSAWAHQSALAGWSLSGSADDAGVTNGRWSDVTHPTETARAQHAEALACAIANIAGV